MIVNLAHYNMPKAKRYPYLKHCFELSDNSVAGSIRMVKGEGMPQYRNPFEKGDLYIKFDVQFPENNWISPEKLNVSRNQ